jgi:excisionase family DNA binding protein
METPSHTASTLLSLPQLAVRWDVNVKTLYALVERGELPTVRIGRLIKVTLSVVQRFEGDASVPDPARRVPSSVQGRVVPEGK